MTSLSAPPPPAEIARLIECLRDPRFIGQEPMRAQAAAALEQMDRDIAVKAKLLTQQAREIERLNAECGIHRTAIVTQAARIRELEAERDEAQDQLGRANSLVEHYKAERDAARTDAEMWRGAAIGKMPVAAIRAKTIEECAAIALMFMESHDTEGSVSTNQTVMLVHARQAETAQDIAEAVRALDQPHEA